MDLPRRAKVTGTFANGHARRRRYRGRLRRSWPATALFLGVVTTACGGAPQAVPRSDGKLTLTASLAPGYSCLTGGAKAMVVGHPDIKFVPAVQSVLLVPRQGGLIVHYEFGSALKAAPEGVYFSWAVYIYRARSDANDATRVLELQLQDRGAGWEPTGWTSLASTYYTSTAVEGSIQTDKAHDELTAFFPAGFGNLSRPFYWFASQEEYRSYLPGASKSAPVNHNVYGSLTTDCPIGVRADPNSLPYPAKLLLAAP